MSVDREPGRDWVLFERIARSLAHMVGNAINVISGRLNLIELDSTLSDDSRNALGLMRARLRRLHSDLKGALDFGPVAASQDRKSILDTLRSLEGEPDLELQGLAEVTAVLSDLQQSPQAMDVPLLYLRDACRRLALPHQQGKCVWSFSTTATPRQLSLSLSLNHDRAPASRRALVEPWFSEEARDLDVELRYCRLLLAEGLGMLEDQGVKLQVFGANEVLPEAPSETRVILLWPID